MAITIELSLEKEEILREEAERQGMKVSDYVTKLLEAHLPKPRIKLEDIFGVIDSSERNGGQLSHLSEMEGFQQ